MNKHSHIKPYIYQARHLKLYSYSHSLYLCILTFMHTYIHKYSSNYHITLHTNTQDQVGSSYQMKLKSSNGAIESFLINTDDKKPVLVSVPPDNNNNNSRSNSNNGIHDKHNGAAMPNDVNKQVYTNNIDNNNNNINLYNTFTENKKDPKVGVVACRLDG